MDSTAIAVQDTTILEADTVAVVEVQDSVELKAHRLLKDTVSIIGVGDIMMGTNFPETWYLPPNEGKDLLKEVNPILKNADVTFGNLEGVILNEGGNPKYCKDPKVCYIFRSPEYLAQNLVTAGFDVMSTANNHAGDFGEPGRKNTMRILDSLNIHHAGQTVRPYSTFMIEGMKYGFAAFSPNTGTMSINDIAAAQKIVAHLDSISDIVIVSFHGGAEGSKYQHVTRKNEYFYGENRGNVYLFAHEMINAGADVIFGHGPHVTRAVEVYNERFIIYSLGNFCTYARFNLRGDNGLAPIVKVFTDSEGKFLKAQVTPIIQKAPGGPSIDEQNRVIFKLQELTAEDFPESQIKIDDSGLIKYIKN
ncbi:CapA family protein [Fulvivirga sp. 2943]|uniref:CapA family protein n=2 Tax=Fulvivirga sediminis TaxID=2803949 RepID=A0A937JZE8_9BACT|nr:CapA family protein [Fulvivirga sediminis]